MPYYPRGYGHGRRRTYFVRRVFRRHRRIVLNLAIVLTAVAGGLLLAKILIA